MTPAGADAPAPRHPRRPQIVLEVLERVQLTPHMVRIVAGGPGIDAVEDNGCTDAYSKILFAHPDTDLTPPYDMEALRAELPTELMPSTRTYTVRRFDLDAGRIWIDFVTHGDEGVAGPWADRARPGDPIVLLGIGGGYAPDSDADWHLLAGDESALPAISSALEALPRDARGTALIEVGGADDEIGIDAPAGVDVVWLHRGDREAGTTELLVDAVRETPWRDGRVQVFVHGERGAMKALRPYFTDERGVERAHMSLSAYWAHGRREDAFQAEKREPIGKI
ncbi:siderophore-interacting protein [Microbacterium sp. gxy059]|uniref:siderophore-interacting protein n=1 Tax=Microbacterium sp. gxy059 TaxID=2957199 RepID=UPI003D9915A2